mgnify:CR=1 FL=1
MEKEAQILLNLEKTNKNGVMTRPIWNPMHTLPMYSHCQKAELINTEWLHQRVVNVPSSSTSLEKSFG